MNKTIKILFLASLVVFACACDDLLDVTPESTITSASMWESEEDVEAAMYGAFSKFRSTFDTDYLVWGDFRSDIYADGYSLGSYYYNDVWINQLDDDSYGTDWTSLYTLINDCNLILKYGTDMDYNNDDDKDYILGNTYFMRAFAYYYIARIWGDAPVLTTGFESDNDENLFPYREDQEKVFNLVRSDVKKAVSLIPAGYGATRGTASLGAAYMLQADVYLWLAKVEGETSAMDTAEIAVNYVLNSGTYQLSDNYENVFRDDENTEIIFQIIYKENEEESPYANDFLIPITNLKDASLKNNPIPVGETQWVIFKDTYKDFLWEDPNDTRATVNVDYYDENYNNWINKYLGTWANDTRIYDTDTRVYRYAEALLFKAEIENESGNTTSALAYLNKVTKRAYGVDNYYSGTYSKDELDGLILDERLKEFATEGKSWFDLIRFDKVFDRVESLSGKENNTNILLWPVNQDAINTNENIAQTDGY